MTLKGWRADIPLSQWDYDIVKPYRLIKDELAIGKKNAFLRGHKIMITTSLQKKAIVIVHESLQGLSKTKALLREKIGFSEINELVKSTIESCLACQAVGKAPTRTDFIDQYSRSTTAPGPY